MFGKMTLMSLICLSGLVVGCGVVSQPGEPASEALPPSPTASRPVAPTTPPRATNPELLRPVNPLAQDEYTWNQLLIRDAIRPIYEAEVEFEPAKSAPYAADELVIGVEINGEAKAYAIGPLNAREMVNDTVGGVPILVTW